MYLFLYQFHKKALPACTYYKSMQKGQPICHCAEKSQIRAENAAFQAFSFVKLFTLSSMSEQFTAMTRDEKFACCLQHSDSLICDQGIFEALTQIAD